jgi:hypothetical protein
MKKKKELTRVEKFYEWMKKCGNIYLDDNEKMGKAFQIVQKVCK